MGFNARRYLYRQTKAISPMISENGVVQIKQEAKEEDQVNIKIEVKEEKEEEIDCDNIPVQTWKPKAEPNIVKKEEEEEKVRWYDNNTFQCRICGFARKSLAMFALHVEKVHEAKLSDFAASYSRTDVFYECQFCLEEVKRENVNSFLCFIFDMLECFGSGSVLDLDSIRSVDQDPAPDPGGKKLPTKIEKSYEISFFKCWMFSFDECSLDALYGGLGISELQFLIKKVFFFVSCKFFSIFGHQNPGSGSRLVFSLKYWIRIKGSGSETLICFYSHGESLLAKKATYIL